jgi:hypothetical protein
MIERIISSENLREKYSELPDLKSLIRTIETELQSDGFVVCQFVLNGMTLSEEDEKRMETATFSEIKELIIRYQNLDELLDSLLKGWIEEIPKLIAQADELSKDAREQRLDQRLTPLVRFVDSCQFLADSLNSFRTIIQVEIIAEENRWAILEKNFQTAVAELLTAFEQKDYVLVADVLEYDVADALQNWFDLLAQIEHSLKSGQGNSGPTSFSLFRRPTSG